MNDLILKKYILAFAILFSIANIIYSQELAIINDKDGYTNIREKPNVNSKVLWKAYTGQIFRVFDAWCENGRMQTSEFMHRMNPKTKKNENIPHPHPDWIYVDLPEEFPAIDTNFAKGGFIHISRLKILSCEANTFKEIEPDNFSFQKDSVKAKVVYRPFQAANHKITIRGSEFLVDGVLPKGGDRPLYNINSKEKIDPYAWGESGRQNEIGSIEIAINNKIVEIPAFEFLGLFYLHTPYLFFDDSGVMILYMHNSDGAGYYASAFLIKDGEYIGRYIFGYF